MNNLAEGWETFHVAEKKQFYNGARRSCREVRSMSDVLLDILLLSPDEQRDFLHLCIRVEKLVSGLIRSLDRP